MLLNLALKSRFIALVWNSGSLGLIVAIALAIYVAFSESLRSVGTLNRQKHVVTEPPGQYLKLSTLTENCIRSKNLARCI
jgi:hypothetical protein